MANEKRLIDYDKMYLSVMDAALSSCDEDTIFDIMDASVVDDVPVVRCRECMHWKPTGSKAGNSFSDMEHIGGCEFVYYCLRESDFCSHGERKDGDE